jgi:hypothetical protein
MAGLDYNKMFSEAQAELQHLQAAKTNLEEKLDEVVKKINAMTRTYNAIAPLVGKYCIPEISDRIVPPGIEALKAAGISVAVKAVLEQFPNENFTAATLRDRLGDKGWDWSIYSNPLSTVHTTLVRLVTAGVAKDGRDKDMKKFFYSATRQPVQPVSKVLPPPRRVTG